MDARSALLMALAAGILSAIHGYPDGAPDTPSVCKSMMPDHNNTLPRSDPSKYQVTVSSSTYATGGSVDVTLVVLDYAWSMEGYMLQARLKGNDDVVGRFSSNPPDSKLICSDGAVTHTDNAKRNTTTFTWTAPAGAAPGEVYFVATVVRGFKRGFWHDVRSPTVMTSAASCASATTAIFFVINLLITAVPS